MEERVSSQIPPAHCESVHVNCSRIWPPTDIALQLAGQARGKKFYLAPCPLPHSSSLQHVKLWGKGVLSSTNSISPVLAGVTAGSEYPLCCWCKLLWSSCLSWGKSPCDSDPSWATSGQKKLPWVPVCWCDLGPRECSTALQSDDSPRLLPSLFSTHPRKLSSRLSEAE